MATRKKNIPLHRLRESTEDGFHIEQVNGDSKGAKDAALLGVHRDDHYIFFLHERGSSHIMVDFKSFILERDSAFFVLPGQVHGYIRVDKPAEGWFLALDVGLVHEKMRSVLENPLLTQRPWSPLPPDRVQMVQCLQMIRTMSDRYKDNFQRKHSLYALIGAFVAMLAASYSEQNETESHEKHRHLLIVQGFRKLLSTDLKVKKGPAEYAAALNLSLSYLNEVVKGVTGFPVSYWIRHEIVLEAKRLLYHSEFSIKEIAHSLGYEDHTYFSRLFKKTEGQTPGEFREHYRE